MKIQNSIYTKKKIDIQIQFIFKLRKNNDYFISHLNSYSRCHNAQNQCKSLDTNNSKNKSKITLLVKFNFPLFTLHI